MKLTKQQTKLHDEAMALVNLERRLTDDEVKFVFTHFHPGAMSNIGKNGVFFTPLGLATDLACMAYPCGDEGSLRYVDACAGIGALSWGIHCCDQVERKISEIVAIEANKDFVEIGRRLLPSVTWVHGSIFDLEILRQIGWFDIGLSNPPFGTLPDPTKERRWLRIQQPAHLAVAEVLAHLCERGADMIIPRTDHSQENYQRQPYSQNYLRFQKELPGLSIVPEPIDCGLYEFKAAAPKVDVVSLNPPERKNPYFKCFAPVGELDLVPSETQESELLAA